MYEIVLGAGLNSYSVLRRNVDTGNLRFNWGPALDCNKFRPFWIDWSNSGIAIGQGTFVGIDEMIVYSNPNQMVPSFIAVSSYRYSAFSGLWMLQSTCAINT
ncbi:hypothetical protein SNE40_016080 [Patella caerulea]